MITFTIVPNFVTDDKNSHKYTSKIIQHEKCSIEELTL